MSPHKSTNVVLAVPKSKEEASQNWKKLVAENPKWQRRRRREEPVPEEVVEVKRPKIQHDSSESIKGFPRYDSAGNIICETILTPEQKRRTWCLAMDCEMVGVGPMKESALARVSIVNEFGYCVLDTYVKPKVKITDYRTFVSGVRPENLQNAPDFDSVVRRVAEMIDNRIVVGHAVDNDFKALLIQHPKSKIRDTSRFYSKTTKFRPGLKYLARKFLKIHIQQGEHNSILDAQVAMKLYLIQRKDWEMQIKEFKYSSSERRRNR